MAKNLYLSIGEVLESKERKKEYYLKLRANISAEILDKDGNVKDTVSLKAGECLNLQDPRKQIQFLMENDHITEDEGLQRLGKLPDFVKYDVRAVVPNTGRPAVGKAKKPAALASKRPAVQDDDTF